MNPMVKQLVHRYGLKEDMVLDLVLPQQGELITIRGVVYGVVYVSKSKLTFTARPIRFETQEDKPKPEVPAKVPEKVVPPMTYFRRWMLYQWMELKWKVKKTMFHGK